MKKTFLLMAGIFPALLIVFSSCSKDAVSNPQQSAVVSSQPAGKGIFDVGTASITATILPEKARAAAFLFSPSYISSQAVADENGVLRFDRLREDTYTLFIFAQTPGFISKRITDIVVPDGQAVDLGAITLDPDTSIDF